MEDFGKGMGLPGREMSLRDLMEIEFPTSLDLKLGFSKTRFDLGSEASSFPGSVARGINRNAFEECPMPQMESSPGLQGRDSWRIGEPRERGYVTRNFNREESSRLTSDVSTILERSLGSGICEPSMNPKQLHGSDRSAEENRFRSNDRRNVEEKNRLRGQSNEWKHAEENRLRGNDRRDLEEEKLCGQGSEWRYAEENRLRGNVRMDLEEEKLRGQGSGWRYAEENRLRGNDSMDLEEENLRGRASEWGYAEENRLRGNDRRDLEEEEKLRGWGSEWRYAEENRLRGNERGDLEEENRLRGQDSDKRYTEENRLRGNDRRDLEEENRLYGQGSDKRYTEESRRAIDKRDSGESNISNYVMDLQKSGFLERFMTHSSERLQPSEKERFGNANLSGGRDDCEFSPSVRQILGNVDILREKDVPKPPPAVLERLGNVDLLDYVNSLNERIRKDDERISSYSRQANGKMTAVSLSGQPKCSNTNRLGDLEGLSGRESSLTNFGPVREGYMQEKSQIPARHFSREGSPDMPFSRESRTFNNSPSCSATNEKGHMARDSQQLQDVVESDWRDVINKLQADKQSKVASKLTDVRDKDWNVPHESALRSYDRQGRNDVPSNLPYMELSQMLVGDVTRRSRFDDDPPPQMSSLHHTGGGFKGDNGNLYEKLSPPFPPILSVKEENSPPRFGRSPNSPRNRSLEVLPSRHLEDKLHRRSRSRSPMGRRGRSRSPRRPTSRMPSQLETTYRGDARGVSPGGLRGGFTEGARNRPERRLRSRSPKDLRSMPPRAFRSRSPRDCKGKLPRDLRGRSPKDFRGRSPKDFRSGSPREFRDRSPKGFRSGSPRDFRGRSPKDFRSRSPRGLKSASRDFRSRSPGEFRSGPPRRRQSLSPRRTRRGSPARRGGSPESQRSREPRNNPRDDMSTLHPSHLVGALKLVKSAIRKTGTSYVLEVLQGTVVEDVLRMPASMKNRMLQREFCLNFQVVPSTPQCSWIYALDNLIDFAMRDRLNHEVYVEARAHEDMLEICDVKSFELAEYLRETDATIVFQRKNGIGGNVDKSIPKMVPRAPPPKMVSRAPPPKMVSRAPPPKMVPRAPPPKMVPRAPPPKMVPRAPPPKMVPRAPPSIHRQKRTSVKDRLGIPKGFRRHDEEDRLKEDVDMGDFRDVHIIDAVGDEELEPDLANNHANKESFPSRRIVLKF